MASQSDMGNLKEDWKQIGEDVASTVQNAVSSGDYAQLSREISDLMNRAVDTAGRTISVATIYANNKIKASDSISAETVTGYRNSVTSHQGYQNTMTAQTIHQMNQQRYRDSTAVQPVYFVPPGQRGVNHQLYRKPQGEKIGSVIGMVIGYALAVGNFLLMPLMGVAGLSGAAGFFGVSALVWLAVGIFANRKLLQTDRFDRYLRVLQDRTYAAIDQLAKATGRTEKFTLRDLGTMIGRGWFRQGHIDEQETTLITSNETYDQYLQTRQAQLTQRAEQAREEENYTPAQREILTQCADYIEEIRRCNDRIPGERISAKLDRLEHTARVIMERVKEEPSLAGELRRLSSYYLPTTVKLLNAYADLDRQQKSSENIENSKREIEGAIDAMNDGFDRLYDSLFDATNLDISTDVEVMRTLLEQEGLTGTAFSSNAVMNGTE